MKKSKRCPCCENELPAELFYSIKTRKDGLSSYCKKCSKKKREENREYFKNYQRKIRNSKKTYVKTGIDRKDIAFYKREYIKKYKRFPEKIKARNILNIAIKDGVIKRGKCLVCGSEKTEGHHEDYSKPLEVKWLCRNHHQKLHHQ